MRSFGFISISLFLLLTMSANAGELKKMVVRLPAPLTENDRRNDYYFALLKLAFQKAGIAVELKFADDRKIEQERQIALLSEGRVYDLLYTMSSKKREEKLRAIYIPLVKGLLGYRIPIIRREDKEKFAAIKTLSDLKKFRVGQGFGWPDTEILQHNLGADKVEVVPIYAQHFGMLQSKRFDYFPRGLHEPYNEIEPVGSQGYGKDLIVDDHILIKYTAPFYFFVNKSNLKLAQIVERGLRQAIKDGSFDRLFNELMKPFLDRAKIENRLVFEFENPIESEKTKALESEKMLWYHIKR